MKTDTYQQEQAIRERIDTVTSMSADQIAIAHAVCEEFGPMYSGVLDRLKDVEYEAKHRRDTSSQVQELLHSVNPTIAARIMSW